VGVPGTGVAEAVGVLVGVCVTVQTGVAAIEVAVGGMAVGLFGRGVVVAARVAVGGGPEPQQLVRAEFPTRWQPVRTSW